MSIFKLSPAYKAYLWGGAKLKTEFNKKSSDDTIAETWELSCHSDGPSTIENGEHFGTKLIDLIKNNNKILGTNCNRFSEFPILIKLIDAKDNLSIQVHPSNEYALKNERQFGKTEMWYIIDCEKNAYLYYGFKKEISKEEFKERIKNNTLLEVLNKVPVKKGDVFFIESGTIHAICAGIVIAEIQQSSNVTYRVYDYRRVGKDGKPRELHIEKALDVTKRTSPKTDYNFKGHLAWCDYFQVDKINVYKNYDDKTDGSSFHSLLFLNGAGSIKTQYDNLSFSKGDSIFIDANTGEYDIEGNCEYLLTQIPNE